MRRDRGQHANTNVRRARDPRSARRRALLLGACVMLAAGFVYAVRQQIVAVELGYRTEELRRERERLLDEQRRLLLALEERASPARLERAARELGLQTTRAAQIEAAARADRPAKTGAHAFLGTASAGAGAARH
jgi:cell division protein FtsL